MTTYDDLLREIYQRGRVQHEQSWAVFVETLNRLSRELGERQQFIADFGHLVPQPEVARSMPNSSVPTDAAPPPVPEATDAQRGEQYQRWLEAVGRAAAVDGVR